MNPMTAALTGALISGVAMYAIGTHAQDRFAVDPALAGNPAMTYFTSAPQPVVQPVVQRSVATPRRTVYRAAHPVASAPVVYREAEVRPHRSVAKTALIIGGSAASGAGVGGIVGGKKGALLGAAIGGGAASIYEATRR